MHESNVLIVHPPDRPAEVLARLELRRPWSRIVPGAVVRVRGLRLRVAEVEIRTERTAAGGERPILHAYTIRDNVVAMPSGNDSPIADLYRYHAFVHRFGCDPDRWLEHLIARGRAASADARLARWIRARMRRDPRFVDEIRRLVAATAMEETAAAR
jgi:hypothetical protein